MDKHYYVYIMTNKGNKVLYTGVTNDLKRRVYEHKNKLVKGFTEKYHVDKLAYYEAGENIEDAILRGKQIKGGSRNDKIQLVNAVNKGWHYWRSCKKVGKDCLAPFPEAKLGGKLAQNVVFAVPPLLI